jgi:hypothetical protein
MHRKKKFSLCHFLKTTHVEHHVKSRSRRSWSRTVLRLRLHQNDAAPCSSGSVSGSETLCMTKILLREIFFKLLVILVFKMYILIVLNSFGQQKKPEQKPHRIRAPPKG